MSTYSPPGCARHEGAVRGFGCGDGLGRGLGHGACRLLHVEVDLESWSRMLS